MTQSPVFADSLQSIAGDYDAFLLDLWGVIHDGQNLYPNVKECLRSMCAHNKKIVFLSNAPRRAHKVIAVLTKLGIEPALYDHVISSGEAGFRWLESGASPWGKKYYYIGQHGDADVLDGLDYQRVEDVKDADFLLNVGFGTMEQSADDVSPLLRAAKAQRLPMLCLNPDLEVVKITGERFACAGVIAHAYEKIGGEVEWFGKPYPPVYNLCMELLSPIPQRRILAIGDSLDTDIPGAVSNGLSSALVTGGILKEKTPEQIAALCEELNLAPTYILPQLMW